MTNNAKPVVRLQSRISDLSKLTTGEYYDPLVASMWESWYAGRVIQKAKGEA